MTPQMGEMIRILQLDAQGVSTSKEDQLKMEKHEPGIIAIQETFRANYFSVKIKGYNSFFKQGNFNR